MSSMISSNVTDSGMSESSEPINTMMSDSITSANNHLSLQQLSGSGIQAQQTTLSTTNTGSSGVEQGHSRNSSNTSQVSAPVHSIAIDTVGLLFKLISVNSFLPSISSYRCLKDLVTVAFHKVSTRGKVLKAIRVTRGKYSWGKKTVCTYLAHIGNA